MMKRLFSVCLVLVVNLSLAQAQVPERKVLESVIQFDPTVGVQTKFQGGSGNTVDNESYKIQLTLMWYANVLHRLGTSESANKLRDEVQKGVQTIASEKGLLRANLLEKSIFIKNVQSKGLKTWTGVLWTLEGKGTVLDFPIGPEDIEMYGPASAIAVIHENTRSLSENGLRLLVLALGGMNKWYREQGSSTDQQSIVKATAYGLSMASDIVQKLAGTQP
ncbi:MAG: hypothetical protein HYU97_00190 [Deltaproteobacteria bacterium]|nr:hypothetical protein [Deltaproteobacteria bacterium]